MKRLFNTTFMLLLLLSATTINAQESSKTTESSETTEISYTPELYGVVKVKMEMSTDNGLYRFDVRNSRIGIKGNASERMKYAIQIDYNDEGSVSILDSWVGYSASGFEFKLGQQQHHFSVDTDRGPSSNPFSNRSFLAKYLTSYFGTTSNGTSYDSYVKTIGSRDIGAYMSYSIPNTIIKLSAGLFNGTGANNPEWSQNNNFIARLDIGGKEGLYGGVSWYTGQTKTTSEATLGSDGIYVDTPIKQLVDMYDGYIAYSKNDLFLEAEYAQRRIDNNGELYLLQAGYLHATYRIAIKNSEIFKYFSPHLRWDMGDNVDYYDYVTESIDRYTASRMTYSLNFGLSEKRIHSELRLAFEDYFVRDNPADFAENMLLHDKFTIEFVAAF